MQRLLLANRKLVFNFEIRLQHEMTSYSLADTCGLCCWAQMGWALDIPRTLLWAKSNLHLDLFICYCFLHFSMMRWVFCLPFSVCCIDTDRWSERQSLSVPFMVRSNQLNLHFTSFHRFPFLCDVILTFACSRAMNGFYHPPTPSKERPCLGFFL